MRRVDALFARYGESHRNPANKAIHWVCVPLITWCVIAFFWAWSPVAAFVFVLARIRGALMQDLAAVATWWSPCRSR